MELADMQDLGSCAFGVRVRLPSTAVVSFFFEKNKFHIEGERK